MDIITKYFDEFTALQISQFSKMEALYVDWNNKINVISRKDIGELYLKHVLHSLSVAVLLQFKPGTKVLDVGCGGGFPGIPLAIMFPEVEFTLVDSIGKKILVVNEVAKALGLTNVKVLNQRAESLNQKFDFIVSRAVTAFPKFVDFTRKLVSRKHFNDLQNGIIYLKGGDFDEEIEMFKDRIEVFDISEFFEESFFETKKLIYLPLL